MTEPRDLWEEFDTFLPKSTVLPKGLNIAEIMTNWTTYVGLVTVLRMSPQDGVISLQQVSYIIQCTGIIVIVLQTHRALQKCMVETVVRRCIGSLFHFIPMVVHRSLYRTRT